MTDIPTEPDLSWIDIMVNKADTFLIQYSPGFDDYFDSHYWTDVIEQDVQPLPCGSYRWTGFTIGRSAEGEAMNISGGTFTRYELPKEPTDV